MHALVCVSVQTLLLMCCASSSVNDRRTTAQQQPNLGIVCKSLFESRLTDEFIRLENYKGVAAYCRNSTQLGWIWWKKTRCRAKLIGWLLTNKKFKRNLNNNQIRIEMFSINRVSWWLHEEEQEDESSWAEPTGDVVVVIVVQRQRRGCRITKPSRNERKK